MKEQPLVSIITPTYNHEHYIADCIKSVQNQIKYDNWEMIVINDCSTDSTRSIIKKYIANDNRIKLVTHKTNWGIKGLQKTYNQAFKLSKGNIIAILEGDDYWPKEKLFNQIAPFLADKKAVLSYGKWEFVNNSGKHIYTRNYKLNRNQLNNTPINSIFEIFITLRFDIISSTVLIKKHALKKIGGFQSDTIYPFVDIPTYLALAKIGKFLYLDKVLGSYRRSKQSSWLFFTKASMSTGREEIKKCINNFINSKVDKNLLTQKSLQEQDRYLLFRKYTAWISTIFNILLTK